MKYKIGEFDLQDLRIPAEYSDLKYALKAIGHPIKTEDVKHLVAHISGENDELNWYWIAWLKNDKYAVIWAWCDYSGWGCQDGGEYFEFNTLDEAVKKLDILHEGEDSQYEKRNIKDQLIKQIEGEQPYGLEIKAA